MANIGPYREGEVYEVDPSYPLILAWIKRGWLVPAEEQ